MEKLLVTILIILFFVGIPASFVFSSLQRKWSRTKADRIIAGTLQADVSFINGIIEILRPRHFLSYRHEDDLYRVEQLRRIRDKSIG